MGVWDRAGAGKLDQIYQSFNSGHFKITSIKWGHKPGLLTDILEMISDVHLWGYTEALQWPKSHVCFLIPFYYQSLTGQRAISSKKALIRKEVRVSTEAGSFWAQVLFWTPAGRRESLLINDTALLWVPFLILSVCFSLSSTPSCLTQAQPETSTHGNVFKTKPSPLPWQTWGPPPGFQSTACGFEPTCPWDIPQPSGFQHPLTLLTLFPSRDGNSFTSSASKPWIGVTVSKSYRTSEKGDAWWILYI